MKNKFKMAIGFFLVLLLLSSCVQTSQNVGLMGRNIQITTDYDGIWQLKMYVGSKYYHSKISVVNGQFYEKYPNGTVLKGYISADGRFSMNHSFDHGGWNRGDFSFTLDREISTTTRLVGKWSGLDGAYQIQDGQQYGRGIWEVIISQQQSMKIDRDKSDLLKGLVDPSLETPPPTPVENQGKQTDDDIESKLIKLKNMNDKGLITQEDYDKSKDKLLNKY